MTLYEAKRRRERKEQKTETKGSGGEKGSNLQRSYPARQMCPNFQDAAAVLRSFPFLKSSKKVSAEKALKILVYK